MTDSLPKPELMSPAGYWPQLRAAIEAGADAVYFGLNHFSARAKVGFSVDELPEVMRTLHRRAVKGFVTFNTLVFDHELKLAAHAIEQIATAGVDAIIVQDVGIAQMARAIAPDLEIHGSTQMSVTSAQGAELAKQFGCSRVVLGRELALADIRKIAQQTLVELEVFVHGALCVSYSGQCFSSEAWGGRSANRGKCAQACRLSYDLIVDGQQRDLGPYRYLLSPGDLCALEQIPELMEIGIACVKIEGRYKDADYVALTTSAYREAIDLAARDLPNEIDLAERDELEQIYSRGLGPHFISGVNHQSVVIGRAPRHRGLLVGQVIEVGNNWVDVELEKEISAGDGLVLDASEWRSPDEPEEGGNVYQVAPRDGVTRLKFGRHEIDFHRIREGDTVWRTRAPQLHRKLKPLTQASKPVFTRPLSFQVTANVGRPLQITVRTDDSIQAVFRGTESLQSAERRALDLDTLEEKLGRLGGTPFHLGSVELESQGSVFVPTSVLNEARRQLVDQLLEQRATADTREIKSFVFKSKSPARHVLAESVALHLLVRTPEQLDAAIECRPASITLDYLELYGLKPSVQRIKDAGLVARVASPRILKPAEQNVVRFLLSLDCAIVIRSGGLLHDLVQNFERLPTLIGDFSLNAANAVSFATYLEMGLTRLTPTYDLNAKQIEMLAKQIEPHQIEAIAYSHLPVFHTEHCVFCRFLSNGTDNTNCGHPCEKHRVSVRDGQGREHPVMADVGCRNTVFGAEAQADGDAVLRWYNAGIQDFRLEFVHQGVAQVKTITRAFSNFFSGSRDAEELNGFLERHSPQGSTEGSLFVPKGDTKLVQLS